MTPKQIAFDLDLRPALGRDDFLVAPCNQMAVERIDSWPDWPGHILALYGPPGSGKSHLANVWRHRSDAEELDTVELRGNRLEKRLLDSHNAISQGRFVLEDIDRIEEGEQEEALFHLINWTRQEEGSLLITSRQAPSRLDFQLRDLTSRLIALPVVQIDAPDDGLLGGLLVKLFSDRQIKVTADLVAYLLPRIDRSFEGVRAVVDKLDRYALSVKRPITIPLARTVLEEAL